MSSACTRIPLYRAVVREVNKSSLPRRATRTRNVLASFRDMFTKDRKDEQRFETDIRNALTFMRAHRMHKALLERYNPLSDLTPEEKIHATARRVGLDMPLEVKDEREGKE